MSAGPARDGRVPDTESDDLDPTLAAIVRAQTGLSWSRARRLCNDGRVTIDSHRALDPAMRVPPGAVVAVDQHGAKLRQAPLVAADVVHVDRDVVVVNKPAGMLSVADEAAHKDTLVDHLRTLLRKIDPRGPDAPLGVVHRIDRETSGLMIFARNAVAKRSLQAQFKAHSILRVYVAVAHGDVPAARMDTWLLPDRGDGMRGSHGHFRRASGPPPPDAKRAITHVAPLEALAGATLVECRLETGRQHQIRIHLAEMGHPLVGERVYIRDYAGPKLDAPRPLLHARVLGFEHPRHGEGMVFECEPPEDFRSWVAAHRQ
jgi:23S rRNA pseudouridine1911/1915/1917 synthase